MQEDVAQEQEQGEEGEDVGTEEEDVVEDGIGRIGSWSGTVGWDDFEQVGEEDSVEFVVG